MAGLRRANMATQILLRRDTAGNWTSADPVLGTGELGLETDTNRIKFGDGTSVWLELPYAYTDPTSPDYLKLDQSTPQTIAGSLNVLNVGGAGLLIQAGGGSDPTMRIKDSAYGGANSIRADWHAYSGGILLNAYDDSLSDYVPFLVDGKPLQLNSQSGANVLVGTNVDDGTNKLQVAGDAVVSGDFEVTGEATVGGSASGMSAFEAGLTVNNGQTGTASDGFVAKTVNVANAFVVDASADEVNIGVTLNVAGNLATTGYIGFFGVTPVAQPATVADADGSLADATLKINAIIDRLQEIGVIA